MENVVITIARQYGSGGRTIGRMLAKELGIPFYNRDFWKWLLGQRVPFEIFRSGRRESKDGG